MIRALIFDFDGVILDTESSLIDAYRDVYVKHGIAFDHARFLHSVGHSDYAFDPWHAFEKTVDRDALEAVRRELNRERDLLLTVLPGVLALLDDAKGLGLRVGLASNSPRPHCERHLERIGLLSRFDFLSCRGEAPLPKPAPDLYQRVLDHFGIRGHEAIAFEDSHTGSLAARRANLWTVAIASASTAHHDFAHAHLRVKTLAEVSLADLVKRFEK